MLQKGARLRKNKDFSLVFKKGKGCKGEFIDIKIARNNQDESRFGFIVSRNLSKNATARNKVKRRLRELIRKRVEKIKGGLDIILIARPGILTKKTVELEKEVETLLIKTGTTKDSNF